MIAPVGINRAKDITIVTDSNTFANASALYTYVLTLHKKVSIVCEDDVLEYNLSCVPWFKNLKSSVSNKADLIIDMRSEKGSLFDWFKANSVKINKKMATALYVDILKNTNNFTNDSVDGVVFSNVSELISLGANYKLCNKFILKSQPLSLFRLKSLMYKTMLLKNDAKLALFYINKEILKSSGASLKDAYAIMQESLSIAHVDNAMLIDTDFDNKQIKIIKGNNN